MRVGMSAALIGIVVCVSGPATTEAQLADQYRESATRIIEGALADSAAFARLTELVDRFGHRFSGSSNLENAIDWMLEEMASDGLDNVHGEPVMVPHWVRGNESVELLEPRSRRLPMLGLGGSVGTPPSGITAQVLVVESFEELRQRSSEARGKIVRQMSQSPPLDKGCRQRLPSSARGPSSDPCVPALFS